MEKLTSYDVEKLNEILTLKNLNLSKFTSLIPLVKDPALKSILEKDIEVGGKQVKKLKIFLDIAGIEDS